jgi:hypothetical protein
VSPSCRERALRVLEHCNPDGMSSRCRLACRHAAAAGRMCCDRNSQIFVFITSLVIAAIQPSAKYMDRKMASTIRSNSKKNRNIPHPGLRPPVATRRKALPKSLGGKSWGLRSRLEGLDCGAVGGVSSITVVYTVRSSIVDPRRRDRPLSSTWWRSSLDPSLSNLIRCAVRAHRPML